MLTPDTKLSTFAQTILDHKYAHTKADGTKETWEDIAHRVASNVVGPYFPDLVGEVEQLIAERKFMPGGRYLYATGRTFHQTQNCLLLTVEDTREGWADLMQRVTSGLMTGAGIGIVYSKLRGRGAAVKGMGGESTGPIALMQMVNETGRHIMQGGSRRSAIWAGLHWNHPDVFEFIALKDWSDDVKRLKEEDFNFPAPMDGTNISVILDDAFFAAYHDETNPEHAWAHQVYDRVVHNMLTTGEPGFSVDTGDNAGEHLRNACTEVTSSDDDDICNLGSLNLARFDDIEEFERAVTLGTAFLLCGTLYSKVPYQGVMLTRNKNRRLGLGLMGIHEWLLVRGKNYAPDAELGDWLERYAQSTDIAALLTRELSEKFRWKLNAPVKTRAIAPTGTIAIIAETTSGIEPVFCVAFKRRYLKGTTWHYQYVVDNTVRTLVERGVDPHSIEDAYELSRDIERRIAFQAWVQTYVDHGISSTLNLPHWGTPSNNEDTVEHFSQTLMTYLPHLRGITAYPDGARGGQPLTKVDYHEALEWEGFEYEEAGNTAACVGGACGV
jgi:ribonucleoside-diphosphate reductase alpha chain